MLYVFLFFYGVLILIYCFGIFAIVYHFLRYRLNLLNAYFSTFLFVSVALILLLVNFYYAAQVDWKEVAGFFISDDFGDDYFL